jgi:hypothetical protein
MCDSIKKEISEIRKAAQKQMTTPGGGKKTITVSNLKKIASSLSNKLHKFQSAAQQLNSIQITAGGKGFANNVNASQAKHLLSQFNSCANQLIGSIKGDAQQLQSVSANTGNQLKIAMMELQEFYTTAPSLIESLANLAKAVANNLKGS